MTRKSGVETVRTVWIVMLACMFAPRLCADTPPPLVPPASTSPLEAIRSVEGKLDIAAQFVENPQILSELTHAVARGVEVKVSVNEEYLGRTPIAALREAGISVQSIPFAPGEFATRITGDGIGAWVSSSREALAKNPRSPITWIRVAAPQPLTTDSYPNQPSTEADQSTLRAVSATEPVRAAHREAKTWPASSAERRIAQAIEQARYSTDVMASRLDSEPVVTAILDAARRGVRVRVLLEDSQWARSDDSNRLVGVASVEFLLDPRETEIGTNVVIVDRSQGYVLSTPIDSASFRCENAVLSQLDAESASSVSQSLERLRKAAAGRMVNRLNSAYQ